MNMKKTILVLIIKLLLWIHSFSYRVVGFLSQKVEEERIHPKHRIMNYHKFFIDNIDENDLVLDIGCGNGALSYDIAKKAKKVVGIDLNEKNIDFTTILEHVENIPWTEPPESLKGR